MRRVSGATTSTTGNAISQAVSQAPIHRGSSSAPGPAARSVEMAETSSDMRPERMKPNRAGA